MSEIRKRSIGNSHVIKIIEQTMEQVKVTSISSKRHIIRERWWKVQKISLSDGATPVLVLFTRDSMFWYLSRTHYCVKFLVLVWRHRVGHRWVRSSPICDYYFNRVDGVLLINESLFWRYGMLFGVSVLERIDFDCRVSGYGIKAIFTEVHNKLSGFRWNTDKYK